MLDAFHLLGSAPEVVLFAISIAPLHEMGTDLSPELDAHLPAFVQAVRDEVLSEAALRV